MFIVGIQRLKALYPEGLRFFRERSKSCYCNHYAPKAFRTTMSQILQKNVIRTLSPTGTMSDANNMAESRKNSDLLGWNRQHLGEFYELQRQLCRSLLRMLHPFHDYSTKQLELIANERRARELGMEIPESSEQIGTVGRDGRRSNSMSEDGLKAVLETCKRLVQSRGTEAFDRILEEKTNELIGKVGFRVLDDVATCEGGPFQKQCGLTTGERISGRREINRLLSRCRELRTRIANENQRLVFTVISEDLTLPHSVTSDELVTVGYDGLLEGIDRFDVTCGTSLSTCAGPWIRLRALRACNLQSNTIQIPEAIVAQSHKLNAFVRDNPDASEAEMSRFMGISEEKVRHLLSLPKVVNPSQFLSEGEEVSDDGFHSADPNTSTTSILSDIDRAEITRIIDGIFSEMNAVQRLIVSLFYGFSGATESSEAMIHRLTQLSRTDSKRRIQLRRGAKPSRSMRIEVYEHPVSS